MYSAFDHAQSHLDDPVRLCSKRSSVCPLTPPRRRLQSHLRASSSSVVAFYLGGSSIFKRVWLHSSTDFNSSDGAFSVRIIKAFLHPGDTHKFRVQGHSSSSQNELLPRKSMLRGLGASRVVVFADDFLSSRNRRLLRQRGSKHHSCVQTRAFNRPNGGGSGGDIRRIIFNLSAAGLLTYFTVTGGLNWIFDSLFSLLLVSAVLGWFVEWILIKGPCPNCGGVFQVFPFPSKEERRLCPYCSQPFKVENKKFVRDEPQFTNQQTRGFQQPFEGFGGFGGFDAFGQSASSRKREDSGGGVIVDVEAEVRDKD